MLIELDKTEGSGSQGKWWQPSRFGHLRPVISSFAASMGMTILGLLLRFVGGFLIARSMGPEEFGKYSTYSLYVETTRQIALLGLNVPVTRYSALYNSRGDCGAIKGMFFKYISVIIILSMIGGAILIVFLLSATPKSLGNVSIYTLAFGVIAIMIGNIDSVRSALLAGMGFVAASKVSEQLIRPTVMLTAVGALILLFKSISVERMVQISVLASGTGLLAGYILVYAILGKQWKAVNALYDHSQLRQSVSFIGVGIMYPLSAQVDALILSLKVSAIEIAQFNIATLLVSVVTLPIGILLPIVYPKFVRFIDQNNKVALAKIVRVIAYLPLLISIPFVIMVYVYGSALLQRVFGTEFGEAWLPLLILSIANVVLMPLLISAQLLSAAGRAEVMVKRLPFAILLSIMLNLAFIPFFGVAGAAVAMGVSQISYSAWLTYITARELEINWLPWSA